MTRPVIIDLSRLLWRARHSTPTGIDRVELAYARHFLEQDQPATRFVARVGTLGARAFDPADLCSFLDRLELDWSQPGASGAFNAIGKLVSRSRMAGAPGKSVTIIPSHQNWHRREWLERRRGKNGRLLLFLHDMIPSQYPEYAREGGARRHDQRLVNALSVADGFIVNSQMTGRALEKAARSFGFAAPRYAVAPIGTCIPEPRADTELPQAPYFITVGTIEPRKNHMLLLLLWRQMAEAGMRDLPRLVVAGRRGWENEQIIDLLERSHALRDLVIEKHDLGDGELAALVAGARALLMPSFAEGFGMPVNEALASGTPVIASNLPVYAETAGDIPEYCDPLDGRAWREAILDYASEGSARRAAQLERMQGWQPPGWEGHFAEVGRLLAGLE